MDKKVSNGIMVLDILQLLIYLVGFYNFAAEMTNQHGWFDMNITNLAGIGYWSLLSMISVIGFVLSIYLLVRRVKEIKTGLIVSAIGFASPILFMFFLIIPATLMILGGIFLKIGAANKFNSAKKAGDGNE